MKQSGNQNVISGPPNYARTLSKLEQTVEILATGKEAIKCRLIDAHKILGMLFERDFPPELQDDFSNSD